MNRLRTLWINREFRPFLVFLLVLLAGIIFAGFSYYALSKELDSTTAEMGNKIAELEKKSANLEFEKTSLSDALYAEQVKNEEFEEQIRKITGQVGTLTKLSQIDPELLKKYSKVFFLNEHYTPKELTDIDSKYLFEDEEEQIHSEVWPFLKRLLADASKNGRAPKVVSGFRSFGTQASLKSGYKVTYGTGANQFSADQGYSEHQLGTTVDFSNPTIGQVLTGFENSEEYKWLLSNAYRYGFILSYPENNAYYVFEPWHWRFVGEKLAKKLHRDKAYFYDMDQREIDSYLINLFD